MCGSFPGADAHAAQLMQVSHLTLSFSSPLRVRADIGQTASLLFEPDLQLQILEAGSSNLVYSRHMHAAGLGISWLPRGRYRVECALHDLELPAGDFELRAVASAAIGGDHSVTGERSTRFHNPAPIEAAGVRQPAWSLRSEGGTPPVEELAWKRGHADWFFRHFDHAALVVTNYLLKRHPFLKGRILDVGCGDGIIDLGIFLRYQPLELVGIDPFRGFERLPEVLDANHLPADLLDDRRLQFRAEDANAIPYPDDYFDVVVSWGSLEHIAGGYDKALQEIRRVLKRDGLLFVHPGLYFGALGNHLGEFFDDPFIHLKVPPEKLREAVLSMEPARMDRAGHVASPEEYWQWYTELNPIRVGEFERELRALGFEPWRVALRNSDLVEYTPELQGYPMQDLATAELYLSAWNRKPGPG